MSSSRTWVHVCCLALVFTVAAPLCVAQNSVSIPLNYNFNGIVHAGENGNADSPNGYRSISDRGLDWTGGVPNDSVLNKYQFVTAADTVDIVHVGNRNTVSGGNFAFDAMPDGDCEGIQPGWLANPDQTGPQTTTLASPLSIPADSNVSVLLQVSNGGGSIDMVVNLQVAGPVTTTVGAPDWFGGNYAGTDSVDCANTGAAGLKITEASLDLSAYVGDFITSITFQNPSNTGAGYAILGASLNTNPPPPAGVTQIPLTYNFNGIVHAGESGNPDDPNGYRSISDRGLNWTAGPPSTSLVSKYSVVSAPGGLDIVHLGDRSTVSGSAFNWEAAANGNCVGTQPAWLTNSDQTGPQTTTLAAPIQIRSGYQTTLACIYQISNGGGSFDVVIGLQGGGNITGTLSGGDWFGGSYAGTDCIDNGNLGAAGLSITEGTLDLSSAAGDAVISITFQNRSNTGAGYAIIGANVEETLTGTDFQIPLNYNFNGMVHAGENGNPDDPNGYRSISDRGLDMSTGVATTDPTLSKYSIVSQAGALDIVHLGNRNTVSGGTWQFDATPDGDNVGIQPAWLANVDQSGPQTTNLASPVTLGPSSTAGILFQVSDGGGSMEVVFGFVNGTSYTATVSTGDWFGGPYPGTDSTDSGNMGAAGLNIAEVTTDLSAYSGEAVTSITFQNRSNGGAGYAIVAANISGCLTCGNPGGVTDLGGSNGISLSTTSQGQVGCAADLSVSGATANAPGMLVISAPAPGIAMSNFFASCAGTLHVDILNPALEVMTTADGNGGYSLVYPAAVVSPALCGLSVNIQYGEYNPSISPCPVRLSNALTFTFGD